MKVNNKIPWGLVTGALGITTVGIFNGNVRNGKCCSRSISTGDNTFSKTTAREKEIETRISIKTKIILPLTFFYFIVKF